MSLYLPAAPLLALVEQLTVADWDRLGLGTTERWVLRRTLRRVEDTGLVRYDVADRVAVLVLGVHPAQVWGDEWWDDQLRSGSTRRRGSSARRVEQRDRAAS